MSRQIIKLLLLLPAFLSLSCERDLTSTYDYGKAETISLILPKGGEKYTTADIILIQWTSVNLDGPLRIELLNDNQIVYSVNDVKNAGNYILKLPAEVIPSKNYLLKIASMIHPEIFDIIKMYFEIAPLIDGTWYYSDLNAGPGFELNVELSSFIDNAFFGRGYFHLRYFSFDSLINYVRTDTLGGTISYPDVNFVMREQNGKKFFFTGQMINNSAISGKISGFVDSTFGTLNDTLTLQRQ
jgi:hypothetical protein